MYVLIGAPALWQLVPLSKAFSSVEASALRGAFNLLKTVKYPAAMTLGSGNALIEGLRNVHLPAPLMTMLTHGGTSHGEERDCCS